MYFLAIGFATAALAYALWFWLFVRNNRRRGVLILRWIDTALAGRGYTTGIVWLTPSVFKVPLRLSTGMFRRTWVLVELIPREHPLRWLLYRTARRSEVITFQSDLDLPPAFSLDIHTMRWFARSQKNSQAQNVIWPEEQAPPLVLTTRCHWQKEISGTMGLLSRNAARNFLNIRFQRKSPHFSATLPLGSIDPKSAGNICLFDSVCELAKSSTASLS
ncbi:MAG TPA: hypothetical protein VKT33_14805 [Candidatus Angelobacter sp.]|nr:hypothetical protein [Candidatus Angelobacter sp.]